jgi:hypothetical protein
MEINNNHEVIAKYYKTVFLLLKNNNKSLAKRILYEELPVELYDESLNMMYDRNEKSKNLSLKKLILKTHKLIE